LSKPRKLRRTRGSALLDRHRAGRTYEELGKELGCATTTAYRLCKGQMTPSRKTAIVCYRVAQIPLTAWDDPT